ncbi:MAG: MBL fold metallo-hydrolase [Spirochaetaceae bacterium]|nr:MBL fold metallo-hydrolase [Spirochaetaceae bacterium]
MSKLTLKFLGTGTSDGIPVIGCSCPVCLSANPKDKRLRTGLYLTSGETSLLLDASPDLREQALKHHITHFDAVLLSHNHCDHSSGLNEMRRFNQLMQGKTIPLYANQATIEELKITYDYFFNPKQPGGGIPAMTFNVITGSIRINELTITPIPVKHGGLDILGYLITNGNSRLAFITDASYISTESFALLSNIDTLVLNALRYRPHNTHFNIEEAIVIAQKIKANKSYFIHFTHDVEYAKLSNELPPGLYAAYDGLTIEI